jgi:hypothetical protein
VTGLQKDNSENDSARKSRKIFYCIYNCKLCRKAGRKAKIKETMRGNMK